MLKKGARAKISCRRENLPGDHSTSGGASETEAKLFAVIPCGPPAEAMVTTVTPVAKLPSASRNSRAWA